MKKETKEIIIGVTLLVLFVAWVIMFDVYAYTHHRVVHTIDARSNNFVADTIQVLTIEIKRR